MLDKTMNFETFVKKKEEDVYTINIKMMCNAFVWKKYCLCRNFRELFIRACAKSNVQQNPLEGGIVQETTTDFVFIVSSHVC